MNFFILAIIISTFSGSAFAEDCMACMNSLKSDHPAVDKLSADVDKSLVSHFLKLADLKVNHAGSGNLSVMQDELGHAIAVKFHYEDGNDKKDIIVSVDDFNKGKGMTYPPHKNNVSPLKLSAIIPPGINPEKGGEFNLMLGTSVDPATYQNNSVHLTKQSGQWQLTTNGQNISKVTLSPGISWASWDGSFEAVKFE